MCLAGQRPLEDIVAPANPLLWKASRVRHYREREIAENRDKHLVVIIFPCSMCG